MKKIIFLLAFLILISGCTEIPEEIENLENECSTHLECILVVDSNECCVPCITYDYATDDIIARNAEEYYEWRAENCEGVGCAACAPTYLNQDKYEARCIENQCVKEAV